MAGKYHRTYLKDRVQKAFEKMQEETGRASNSFIAECVSEKLKELGYLVKPELILPEETDRRSPRRRARRA